MMLILLVLVQVVAATVGAMVRRAQYKQGAEHGDAPSQTRRAASRKDPFVSLHALHARNM
jgi:hypothetical protein